MNPAHAHLLLNHFPIVGLFFAFLTMVAATIMRKTTVLRVALSLMLLAGLFTIPTFLSGEPAEEVLESRPGFSSPLVHEHEEAAEITIWLILATSLLAGATLIISNKKDSIAKPLVATLYLLALLTLISLARTNNLGGKISHPEIGGIETALVKPESFHDESD